MGCRRRRGLPCLYERFVVGSRWASAHAAQGTVIQMARAPIANGTEVHPPIQASWGDPNQQLERAMITNAFLERQVALRRDTEKLLSLATELKQNVDKTSPSILSMDVIKKAQEIEKLAKSVKDKMKNAY